MKEEIQSTLNNSYGSSLITESYASQKLREELASDSEELEAIK